MSRPPDFFCMQYERTLENGDHLYYQPGAMRHHILSPEDVTEHSRRAAYDARRQSEREAAAARSSKAGKRQRAEMIATLQKEFPGQDIPAWVEAHWSHEHIWAPRPEIADRVRGWLKAGFRDVEIVKSALTREMSPAGMLKVVRGLGLKPGVTMAQWEKRCGKWVWPGTLLEKKGIRNDDAPLPGDEWSKKYGDPRGGIFSPGWVWK